MWWWRPRRICRRNNPARRRRNLSRNGEILLRLQVSFSPGQSNPIRMFTLREIQEATNTSMARALPFTSWYNYNWGVLDGRRVAIKYMNPSSGVSPNFVVEALITEIAILSNIHHRNVVRLVGCCLETPVPLLVHESIILPNGNLEDHLERWATNRVETPPLSTRLRIAIDVADALNYIHSFTSRPIVHKDVHAGNILLDEDYNAKLSDFSLSVPIPSGQTHVATDTVTSSYGLIDPEYATTGVVTEKVDVYAFGVLLIELLRGETFGAFLVYRERECGSHFEMLAMWTQVTQEPLVNRVEFTVSEKYLALKEEFLVNLVGDAAAALGDAEGEADHIRAVAELALQCARPTAHERPTMKEVTQQLRRIRSYVAPYLACTRGARYAGL
uniref:Wall-associated receptor kinase-like 10 n=1 Tax=Anthurium amnicola TaxID=1678845 RepID=A0A1D1YEY2_9ARAE